MLHETLTTILATASPLYPLRVLLKKGVYKGFLPVSHEGLDVCIDNVSSLLIGIAKYQLCGFASLLCSFG